MPRPKLALDVPEPPPVTREDVDRMLAESREWGAEMSRRTRSMERLTPEDLRTVVR